MYCIMSLCGEYRLAAQAQNLKKAEGPRKLYVGSLHYSVNETILKGIFEPFGAVDKIQLMRDENGLSKGYAFVEVIFVDYCSKAVKWLINEFFIVQRFRVCR